MIYTKYVISAPFVAHAIRTLFCGIVCARSHSLHSLHSLQQIFAYIFRIFRRSIFSLICFKGVMDSKRLQLLVCGYKHSFGSRCSIFTLRFLWSLPPYFRRIRLYFPVCFKTSAKYNIELVINEKYVIAYL